MSRTATFFLSFIASGLALFLAFLGWETLAVNPLGWFLLAVGIAYPVGVVVYSLVMKKPFWKPASGGETVKEESGDRSFWLILPGFLLAFFGSPVEFLYFSSLLPRTVWMQFLGWIFLLAGVILFVWARRSIRDFYGGHVEVSTGQQLVQSGPYRWIRHPAYAGYLLMCLGLGIGYSSLVGLVAIPLLLLPGLSYRMKVEENLLAGQFGELYREYAHRTKKLIPGLW